MTEDKTLLLKSLMDAFPEGIISMDMEGNITRINKGAIDILGYNSVNLIGKPLFDFAPSFARDDIKDLLRELEDLGTIKDRKIQLYDVKGKLRNLKISLSLLKDAKKTPIGILSTIQDIKEVALLEKELEELQDFFHDIIDNAGVGIVATDLKGNIIFANLGAKDLFKRPLEEMIGVNIIKDSQAPSILNERFNNLIKTGDSFEYESEIIEEGRVRNLINIFTLLRDRNKNPAGVIVVFKDLSRLKEIESQLKKSNAILKEYTKNLESLVEVTRELGSSLEEGTIYRMMVETSKKMLNVEVSCFFRYSKTHKRLSLKSVEGIEPKSLQDLDSEMAERGVYSFLLNLKAPKLVADLSAKKSLSLPTRFLEAGLKAAAFVPIFSKDKIFGVLAVFLKEPRKFKKEEIEILQSIGSSAAIAVENAILYNEIKEFASNLEKKVRERTVELEHSNKLKDLFIDIMGHDLLKPAEIARLNAEFALDREEDLDKIKTLQTILQSNERIIDMIENASILAKLESKEKLEFKESDLGFILKSVVKEITDSADEKKVKVKVAAEGEFKASVNPLIYDVFSNLITNAIKYGPEDSDVVVEIEEDDSNWKISVADNGPGIPDEHKEAVFERFKRIKKGAVKGTGLGLAIVKRVVEAHKGRVWVEDNPDGGSVFYVQIPRL